MHKINFFILLLLGHSALLFGQDLPQTQLKLSLYPFALESEVRRENAESFNTTNFSIIVSPVHNAGGFTLDPQLMLALRVEPRFYLDLDRRQARGYRVDNFSGFFLAVPIQGANWATDRDNFYGLTVGLNGGFQYTFSKRRRWYVSASVGPGFRWAQGALSYAGTGLFRIGYILRTREE